MQFKLFSKGERRNVSVVDTPEARAQYKKSKKLSVVFIAFLIIVGLIMTSYLFFAPYDNGTISPSSLSGNLNFGGYAASGNGYVFYRGKDGSLNQFYSETDETTRIFDGDISNINLYDSFVYFTDSGKIYKSPYYGMTKTVVADDIDCPSFSVNGSWIYYLCSDGSLCKMMSDGTDRRQLVPAEKGVTGFTADNRRVVYSTARGLYSVKSDGTDEELLAKIENVYFTYYQDCVFYTDKGKIKRIFSLAGGVDGGIYPYTEIKADVFNFTIDSDGAGIIYYIDGESLFVRQMTGKNSNKENTIEVASIKEINPPITGLYCLDSQLFVYCDDGSLYSISVDSGYKGTVKKIY